MNLTQEQTARLKTAIEAQTPFFTWLKHDIVNISNDEYANIRADFQAWEIAYNNNELIIHGQTTPLSGIGSFPIPPAR